MLFQRPNPFPMSIIDNVLAGVRAHKMVPRKEFKTVAQARLTEVGLWDAVKDRLGDSPFRLSGGQQQLLCLARALAVNPEVLLLDEPTSSLDPTTTERIEELIRSLAKRLTVIMVTHDLAQAARIGDRTALFFDGRLIEEGPTEQLFLAPKHAETVRYVSGLFGDRGLLGLRAG
jgi:phosphate transport system ATP-binding protein